MDLKTIKQPLAVLADVIYTVDPITYATGVRVYADGTATLSEIHKSAGVVFDDGGCYSVNIIGSNAVELISYVKELYERISKPIRDDIKPDDVVYTYATWRCYQWRLRILTELVDMASLPIVQYAILGLNKYREKLVADYISANERDADVPKVKEIRDSLETLYCKIRSAGDALYDAIDHINRIVDAKQLCTDEESSKEE